jgi:TfoX/Sxy family transcriptional regulator of competence genes
MTADQDLVTRIRALLANAGAISEMKMFGGNAFMLNGNMLVSSSKRGLMLRVGKDQAPKALTRPGTRQIEMRGRPMEGYIRVDPAGLDDNSLREWLALATSFVKTLPAKSAKAQPAKRGRGGGK